ncbi:SidA/IucD/PvdA family monooxygenase [Sinorhizobium meliloti]
MIMTHFDLAGIGIGPFNLGLAALLSSHENLSNVFLERKPAFRWHEGLILPGTTLQVPFMADLVTMADPTHRLMLPQLPCCARSPLQVLLLRKLHDPAAGIRSLLPLGLTATFGVPLRRGSGRRRP